MKRRENLAALARALGEYGLQKHGSKVEKLDRKYRARFDAATTDDEKRKVINAYKWAVSRTLRNDQ